MLFLKGALHCLLAINSLLEHAVRTVAWVPEFEKKVLNSSLTSMEHFIFYQQKVIFYMISDLVPKKSKAGFFDDPYTGGQGKISSFSKPIKFITSQYYSFNFI